jgi:hypothetical protein
MTDEIHISNIADLNAFNPFTGIKLSVSEETIKKRKQTESETIDCVITILNHEHLHEAITETAGDDASRGLDRYLQKRLNTQYPRSIHIEKDGITPKVKYSITEDENNGYHKKKLLRLPVFHNRDRDACAAHHDIRMQTERV